ncbi:LysR family transcriptional regulator [Gloeobacter kilaueensis]|uniref:LysR family transcriptional regulator n=1 Tax=Gloeobacter kilaueensis (strain ATCC BAA-2537 / CCAP 1431/1 / ULC 316 / JS1) TaxID=1183438 RepID=U5QSI4_GLOK1|nr:LysR family transcriptional regulator [Gloeobacter kilaueensis]AGY60634.1 LysR family transcriptional regulator [Gloeobacter kilaueensis JS1]
MNNFSLDQIRIFRAIAQHGSFKRAAESLYISQPAVSLQVQNLEAALGMPLFDRSGRKAELTEAGRTFLIYAERILMLCDESRRAITDLQNLKGGTLVIGASQTTGTYLIPRLIGEFHRRYPEVGVQLHVMSTRRTAYGVAEGKLDLGIIGGEVPSELQGRLHSQVYAEDELALVVPEFHPLAGVAVIPREMLYELKFIALDPESTTRRVLDNVLGRHNIDVSCLAIEMELSSIEAIKTAVQAGLGVAFISATAIAKELKLGVLHRVAVEGLELRRPLTLLTHPQRFESRASHVFREQILPFSNHPQVLSLPDSAREPAVRDLQAGQE